KTGTVTLTKGDVGLGAVDNTSDASKPISTATQAALDAKQDSSTAVRTSGNQTIAGVKTFSSAPVVPDNSFSQAKVNGLATALNGKVGSATVSTIWTGSQSAYDGLGSYDSST